MQLWSIPTGENKLKGYRRKKKNKSDLSRQVSNAFALFIIGPIYPKKSFEVKINCIKTTSIYKLIYNYKMLLTSKCTIKTLNVNSTHWGGTEIKRLKLDSHIHKSSRFWTSHTGLIDQVYPASQIRISLRVWIHGKKTGGVWLRNIWFVH